MKNYLNKNKNKKNFFEEMSRNQQKVKSIEGNNQNVQMLNDYNKKLEDDIANLKLKMEKAQRDVNLKSLDVINLEKELNNHKINLNDTEKELNIKEKYIKDCDSDVTRYVNENKNLKQDNVRLAQM